MSRFDWLDVGTFLNETFGFPMSQFFEEVFKGFLLPFFPFFTLIASLTSVLSPFSEIL